MPIPIDRIVRSKRSTVALIIHRDGSLIVRAPLRMSDMTIQEFVKGHAEWIQKKQSQAKATPPVPEKRYVPGEKFLFLGKEYPLTVTISQSHALIFKDASFQLARSALPNAKEYFIRWYKVQARHVLVRKTDNLSSKYGLPYQKIRISSARTRWGSCSSKESLSFTWRLVMAPPEIIEYVVVHELVHTKIHNHSKKFWESVERILPDYQQHQTWLRKNGKDMNMD